MKSLVNFLDLELTKGKMLQLNGGGGGGSQSGPGTGSTTTTPALPINLPGSSGVGLTVTVGGPQSPIAAMSMLAGTDMSFGSTGSGAFLGSHEAGHTAQQGTGAYR